MPEVGSQEFNSGSKTGVDVSMNKSANIGEILKDQSSQNRVVDNVMNYFRYKD